jgi:hypothetical protein
MSCTRQIWSESNGLTLSVFIQEIAIRSWHPQWKGNPDYIMSEEDLPDFDNLTTIDHPHFALILLKVLVRILKGRKGWS